MTFVCWYLQFTHESSLSIKEVMNNLLNHSVRIGGGRVKRRCWVNFQCRGVLLVWMKVGQGPTAPAVGAGGVVLTFFLSAIFSLFFLPLFGRRPDID